MLTKRAQILFDNQTYKALETIARQNKSSVGALVRLAVEKTFAPKSNLKKPRSVAEAAKDTFGAWEHHPKTDHDFVNSLSSKWSEPDNVFEKS